MARLFGRGSETAGVAIAVTPADSNVGPYRGIYVGGTGNLVVIMADDDTGTPVTFTSVPTGSLLPIAVRQIRAATTATNIVGLI